MKKILSIILIPFFIYAQDCTDDDYTIEVGLSVWTSGITGCNDGISFLENAGYLCSTSLSDINNPFWGSNPNETLANICGCTCAEQIVNYCEDTIACNYGLVGDCEYIQEDECDCEGVYPDFGYDCNGNCLNDVDNDGLCDEFDNCLYNEISVSIEGSDSEIGWNIAQSNGWAILSGGLNSYSNFCIQDDCWIFNMYDGNGGDGWFETNYTIFYSNTNELISSGTLIDGNFCSIDIQIGNSISCQSNYGCTDHTACNYNCEANVDNSSCEYANEYYNCEGNCLNDFDQDGICDELETNPCELLPDPGPCFAAIPIYFFNQQTSQCEETIWGGCDGVIPFETLLDCQNQCQNISSIKILANNKKLLKSINILGQENIFKNFIIKIYDDGSVEKIYK